MRIHSCKGSDWVLRASPGIDILRALVKGNANIFFKDMPIGTKHNKRGSMQKYNKRGLKMHPGHYKAPKELKNQVVAHITIKRGG